MNARNTARIGTTFRALVLALSLIGVCTAQSTPPDLTAPGVIVGIDRSRTYNLGSTGLRGWIHLDTSKTDTGQISDTSRQILVTVASPPGSSHIQVDDVILGAIAASSGTVPSFTSDARKAMGAAITDAEKTGAGTLRLKIWRAGNIIEVNISIATLGTYSATAPYNSCPKSTAILASTRNQMVGELLADSNYLNRGDGHARAIHAIALLASVQPGDPNYAQVQTRLQTYARSLANRLPGNDDWNWEPAYQLVFLAEYYLLTSDSQVVPTINSLTLWLSQSQNMFGNFGHAPSVLYADGSGRRVARGYGPVNAVGNIANIAIVLGKKALLAAGQPIDPKIDTAIQRAAGHLGSYVNKGSLQYGEHVPAATNHASNGKDASAAVFFGLQENYPVQTEYFSRMAIAGWIGVERGHAGQELGLLWSALGAGMAGETGASEHFKQLLWRFDIQRRTNGSFAHCSRDDDFYNGSSTSNETYLGESSQYSVKGTAIYLLTYSLPLKRLLITGKQANPAYTLDSTKVADAVAAGAYHRDYKGRNITQLFSDLGAYDPMVRFFAANELAIRSGVDLAALRALLTSPDPNLRGSAAQCLGLHQDATSLPTIVGMLRDSDHWVRYKAAVAIPNYTSLAVSTHRNAIMEAFIANAPADPNVIDWTDPFQFSNSAITEILFGINLFGNGSNIANYTVNAPKETHLYPALRIALQLPTGLFRKSAANFIKNRLNLADLQAVYPELVVNTQNVGPADPMFGAGPRADTIAFMAANKIKEGIPLAIALLEEDYLPWGSGEYRTEAVKGLATYGAAARYTLPTLRGFLQTWRRDSGEYQELLNTIATIENAITAPATNPGLCVAHSQTVASTGAIAITLTGASPRGAFSFLNVSQPAHGTLTDSAPTLTYTPNPGYSGTDKFTFQTADSLTTSDPATVSIIVGAPGNGITGTYFNNADFTSQVLSRTDPQIDFDWGTGSPDPSIGADTFSTRWSGFMLVPETGTYTLSALTSDGVRAYLNGVPIINNLNDQSTRWTDGQPISLTAGQKVPLFVEYYESTGSAVAKFKWTGPSIAGLNGDIIPQTYLYTSNSSGGTDTTLPTITVFSPADNAIGVATTTDLVATFSENIVPGTGNITLKNLSDGTQTVIPVTDTTQVTISGATLFINPPADLANSKNYAVQIDATAIDDTAGNSFPGINSDATWNFTAVAPRVLPVLKLHLDASQLTGLSDGATVTTWTDMSGRGNHATASGTPIYKTGALNGRSVIRFNDSSQFSTANLSSQFPTAATVFIVATFNNDQGYTLLNTNPGADEWWRWPNNGRSDPAVFRSTRIDTYCPMPSTGSHLFAISSSASRWEMWVNGTSQGFANGNYHPGGVLRIGNGSSGGGLNGDIAEIQIYDGVLTASEANQIGLSLTAKYGLNTSYPPPVPDTTPPTISSFSPAPSATDAFVGTNLVANFSEPIAIGTGNITLKNLTDATQTTIAITDSAQVSISGAVLTINPAANLLVGKNYAIQIANTAVKDQANNNFAGITNDTTWNFTTLQQDETTFSSYRFTATSLRDNTGANSIQLSEFQFAMGANVVNLSNATITNPGGSNPGGEGVANIKDGNTATKWLDFNRAPLVFQFAAATMIDRYRFATANDQEGRDPVSWRLEGSQNGTTWVLLDERNLETVPTARFTYTNWFVLPDNSPPSVMSYLPADNAIGVDVGANLVATFSENIAIGTGNITLKNPSDATQTSITLPNAQVTASGAVLTINPTADLLPGKNYSIQIAATAIDDTAGNSFDGISNDTTWNFATASATPPPSGAVVWNVNIGNQVTTSDNFAGAAVKNTTPNSFWNSVTSTPTGLALKDFTEASTTVSLTMSAAADLGFGNVDLNSGPKIFNSWTTGNGNSVFTMTLGGLSTASGITYDLIVYSDWWWNNGDNLPVTQTVGSGLGGTVYLNHIKTGTIGIVPGLVEDTSTVAANDSTQGNWIRITGLTPDGSGNLAFNMGGQNAALNGFQLVQVDSVAADTTAPTPNPMTFASPPAALDQTSITMTVTTASDPSGVEYFFECTAGGGHSSAWQDSPTYTDTGLTAATEYSYRVRARDKSAVQTATAWSATASATTTNTPYGTWSGGAAFDGDANNDGVDNGMAWLLGAADLSENAAGKLPKATHNGSNLRLTFRCLKSTMRGGVVLKVQYSSDMGLADPWTSNEAAVPDEDATVNGVVFDTSDDGDYIHVIAEIPAAGAKLFARLSAVVAP